MPNFLDGDSLEAAVQDLDAFVAQHPEKAAILLDEGIKRRVRRERHDWVTTAKMVAYVKQHELWRYHPAGFASFFEWAEQPEIALAASVVSDMVAVVSYAPELARAGIDIYAVIEEAGPSKVRALIPHIREAVREGTVAEQVVPLIDAIASSSYQEVLEMTRVRNTRHTLDPDVVCEELANGNYRVSMELNLDELEILARKLGIKRWYGTSGHRIDPPVNAPGPLARGISPSPGPRSAVQALRGTPSPLTGGSSSE